MESLEEKKKFIKMNEAEEEISSLLGNLLSTFPTMQPGGRASS